MDEKERQEGRQQPLVGAMSVGDIRTEKHSVNEKRR